MSLLYATITALILACQGIIFKIYAKKVSSVHKTNDFVFYFFNFLVCTLILLVIALIVGFDGLSLLYGAVCGLIFCAMIITYAKSLKEFKIALVNFVLLFAVVIPIGSSAIILKEPITVLQWVGFGILLISSYLVCFGDKISTKLSKLTKKKANQTGLEEPVSQETPKDAQPSAMSSQHDNSTVLAENTSSEVQLSGELLTSTTKKPNQILYIIILIIAVISNGSLSAYIKITYNANSGMDTWSFLFAMFAVPMVITFILSGVSTKGFKNVRSYLPNKLFIILAVAQGVVTTAGNIAFNNFSVISNASIFYPVATALPMFIATVISPAFKEKLSVPSLVGIAVGIAGIVLLNV